MSLTRDPDVAKLVATTLDELSTEMSGTSVSDPLGFDWSQESCTAAQRVVTDTIQQLANVVGNIGANTADCAAGFEKYDQLAKAVETAARLTIPR